MTTRMAKEDADLSEPLRLPDVERIQVHGTSSLYGASDVAAAYCGFNNAPSTMLGSWQHGWNPSFREPHHPNLVMGTWISRPDDRYFVARKDEEDFLRVCGYTNVVAIGLPLVYLPPREVRRRPGSLLVMPVHSLEYTTHAWKFDEYAEEIAAIRSEFSEVVVCIHPSCWKKGYWVDSFRKLGFPLVLGASIDDRNALERVRYLLSSFEYVTTNSLGSQLAYAAYFGAKPSIYGSYASLNAEDFKNDPLFLCNPKLLEPCLRANSEEELRQGCPQLFCHPREAKADVEWGRFEVGAPNKVSPIKMRSLFGWIVSARVTRTLASKTPHRLKHWARMLFQPSYREQHRETQRLWAMSPYQPTRTSLLGPSLEVLNAHRFLETKTALFDQELYRFATNEDAPRILICGASIGLSVCYFKQLYPKSDIIAFEPDPRVYEVLERNCASWGAHDVCLIPKAVWTCETTLALLHDGTAPGRVAERANSEDVLQVPTCRLRDYLTRRVDLLRINIEGAEVDVLLDCADLLGQVQNLAVDYHSVSNRPQRLDTLMGLLTRAGFRMHFRATSHGPSPLLYHNSQLLGGMDCKFHIFAFRE